MLLSRIALPFLTLGLALKSGNGESTVSSPQVVDLGYAKYQGVPSTRGNTDFLGIRYAAPPTGDLRFREPRVPAKVNGTTLANTQPARCPGVYVGENGPTPGMPPLSEDCLFLNVIVPGTQVEASANLPVVVWIHGGGYFTGSISYPGEAGYLVVFDGNDLVQLSDGKAIVVMIQYRLGAYGFLSGEDVKQDGALNAGLLDQQFALKWVQRHISKFGGDPRRVTIWGESAGAGSVLQQLVANGGHTKPPLFNAAILSSMYHPPQYRYNDRIIEAVYSEVVTGAGCGSSKDRLNCLRGVSTDTLDRVVNDIVAKSLFYTFPIQPVIDGSLIRERPFKALEKRRLNTRNILAVHNTNEGSIFVDPNHSGDIESYITRMLPTISPDNAKRAAQMYEGIEDVKEQVSKVHGEYVFICPTYALLGALEGHAYKGHFAVPPAAHYEDAQYYFPSSSPTGAPLYENEAFTNTFAGSFLDFVVHGTPNANRSGSLLPFWPKWSERSPKEVVFNRTEVFEPNVTVEDSHSDLLQRCRFWNSIAETIGH